MKCGNNVAFYVSNLATVERELRAQQIESRKAFIQSQLAKSMTTFVSFPEKTTFLDQFAAVRSRYKFLVVEGASQTGKSVWCRWLFGCPDLVLETNCAACPEPDLRKFNPLVHKGILFDEAKPTMVLSQKKLFQAPAEEVELGCSTTNCFSYKVFVSGVALMICSNTWKSDLHDLKLREDREWLEDNSVYLDVGKMKMYHDKK